MKKGLTASGNAAVQNGFTLDFIPFGFQYYRAPTPSADKWERDLKKLAQDGYNTVKYWVQWRWNQPQPDVYDFSDIDALMAIAEKNGLKVILNIILDVAPVWLEELYPDVAMITNAGEKIYGRATEYRQIGGVPGPCLHHKGATELRMRFVEECAKRYRDHKALWLWDVWNEPELSVGLCREPQIADLLCYCPNSIAEFRKWLADKYKDIRALNAVWGRNYRSFRDAEPSRRRGTTMDMVDWRLFFCDSITEDFRLRVERVKKYDTVHPVMCHTVPPPLFNSITCCSDDFKIAKIGDFVGNSVGSSALASSILRGAAKGKAVINSEIHAVYGNILNGFHRPSLNDMLKHIFIPLVNGVRGFIFWQYSPEKLGMEAPAWGNIDLQGRSTPWDLELQRIHTFVRSIESSLLPAQCEESEIGIYLDAKNEICSWVTSFGTELYNESLFGMFNMFHRSNYAVDFFDEEDILNGNIGKFKAVCFPAALCLRGELVQKIEQFAAEGGKVYFESYAGMVDTDTGRHCEDLPGCGIAQICGLTLESIDSTTMIENGYDNILHDMAESSLIPFSYRGKYLCGAKYVLTYRSDEKAETVAKFGNGRPAVYRTAVKKGEIFNATTLLSFGCNKDSKSDPKLLLEDLFGKVRDEWREKLPYGIRADKIAGADLIVLQNLTDKNQTFVLPFEFEDVFGTLDQKGKELFMAPQRIAVLKI